MIDDCLRIGKRIVVAPVVHGSGDFAVAVRQLLLQESFDCLALPLPPSFKAQVESATSGLPVITCVVQSETPPPNPWESPAEPEEDYQEEAWEQGEDHEGHRPEPAGNHRCYTYVPIDPCQSVIAALRFALSERIPRAYIDLETNHFESATAVLPDPYALKKVSLTQFATAVLPTIRPPAPGQPTQRVRHMAERLRQLEKRYERILFVCSVLDWPWVREAYQEQLPVEAAEDEPEETTTCLVEPATLMFMLGELPFITGLYEQARAHLDEDQNLSIDGVRQLLIEGRQRYSKEFKSRGRKITPHLLSQCLKYVRNLCLLEHRFTPDLYTLLVAAKQTVGDQYALHLAETAREYPFVAKRRKKKIHFGVSQARFDDGQVIDMVSRLPGPPLTWRTLDIQKKPIRDHQKDWQMSWNPYSQCSWPPEDVRIENFRAHVFDKAKAMLGADLARTEKFTTSVMDGIDIRETLRHFYDGQIYVKVLPPSRGRLDCVVMLFDSPADPREYPWRATWYAEHKEESTLAFFASNFMQEMVGPGIGLANYGGALFLYPPVPITDIWQDDRLDFTETLEERLLAAGCMHSTCPHVALLSHLPPGPGYRRLAKHFGKKLVHLPLSYFSDSTIQQLRMVHVLNGQQVRSYAAEFIRKV